MIIIFSLKFKRINEQSFDLSLNVIRFAMAVLLACVVGGDCKNILRLSSSMQAFVKIFSYEMLVVYFKFN